MPDIESNLVCPKCGAPRLAHAWDCVKCGVVFDGRGPADDDARPEPVRSTSKVSPRDLSSGSIRVKPKAGGLDSFRAWIDAYTWIAVVLAAALYAAMLWGFSRVAMSGIDSPEGIKLAYREVVGGFPPPKFEPLAAGHFVGRRLAYFEQGEGMALFVYSHRWPARAVTPADLDRGVERILDFLEIDWSEVRRGKVGHGGKEITARILLLGDADGDHVYLFPIEGADGNPALVILSGPHKPAREFAKEIVERF